MNKKYLVAACVVAAGINVAWPELSYWLECKGVL